MVPIAYSTVDMPDSSTARGDHPGPDLPDHVVWQCSSSFQLVTCFLDGDGSGHAKPAPKISPASPATGDDARAHEAGRKHSQSGPAIFPTTSPLRRRRRRWLTSAALLGEFGHTRGRAVPDDADRRASLASAADPSSDSPSGTCHAASGSAPRTAGRRRAEGPRRDPGARSRRLRPPPRDRHARRQNRPRAHQEPRRWRNRSRSLGLWCLRPASETVRPDRSRPSARQSSRGRRREQRGGHAGNRSMMRSGPGQAGGDERDTPPENAPSPPPSRKRTGCAPIA